tara:strand:+ start:639 stop:2006 length:1368 start_codon:yes stop_codon:yes gene_type:complete
MSDIVITKSGLGFTVTFTGDERYEGIWMKFHNFETDRGDPRPEVIIKHSSKKKSLFDRRVNLNSPTSIGQAVKSCTGKVPEVEIWEMAIDDACSAVRDTKRQGSPVQDLRELELSESSRFAIEPFLLQNQANLFYGNGGLGKSWVSLYFAVLMAAGHTHQGFTPEPGKVLYLDYESDAQDMNARFKALCEGLNIKQPQFDYRRMSQSIPMDVERLLEIIDERDITLVIIDSAAPAAGGEPEKSGTALDYFNALSAAGITSLTIGHVSKDDAKDKGHGKPFGSIFWWNEARNIWVIEAGETYDNKVKEFALHQTKFNSGGGERPIGLRFTFDDPRIAKKVEVERIDISSNDALMENMSWMDKIINVINETRKQDIRRPFEGIRIQTVIDFYSLESVANNIISKNLNTGLKKNILVKLGNGYWDHTYSRLQDEYNANEEVKQKPKMNMGYQSEHSNR